MPCQQGLYSQSYGLSNSCVQMWELDHKEGWVPKNWCFQILVLKKTLKSPLDSKEIKPVNPKGNQPWILIGRADAEAPILQPPDVKSWHIVKDPDTGKDWGQEEKEATEDEMFGWHHRLNEHKFEQTTGDNEEQWRLGCCSPCGCKELDTTWQLSNKVYKSTRDISATMGRAAVAATWKPDLPQSSLKEGKWTWTWSEPAEAAKVAWPPLICLCKFRGAICIGKM